MSEWISDEQLDVMLLRILKATQPKNAAEAIKILQNKIPEVGRSRLLESIKRITL